MAEAMGEMLAHLRGEPVPVVVRTVAVPARPGGTGALDGDGPQIVSEE